MKKILTSDISIADYIVELDGNAKLQAMAETLGMKPDGKLSITKDQFNALLATAGECGVIITPGGSSANVMATLGKLLEGKVHGDFISATGREEFADQIRTDLKKSNVTLLPKHLNPPEDNTVETAQSFVLLYPNGKRSIATYPGNAGKLLKADMITDDMVKNADAMLIQGSLWQKLDWDFTDKLLDLRAKHKKELWLALPTHAQFGADKKDHFEWLLPSSNVVMANIGELARVTGIVGSKVEEKDITPAQRAEALNILQQAFQEHFHDKHHFIDNKQQVGFITMGKEGAAVVTYDKIEYVQAAKDPEGKINTLGAGDTSFAGFLAGHVQGLPPKECAEIAMELAGAKLKVNGPRLRDPQMALHHQAPELAEKLLGPKGAHHSKSVRAF